MDYNPLNLIRTHKKLAISFFTGLLLFFSYVILYKIAKYEIIPALRMLGYFSFLLITGSLFLFYVIKKRTILANLALVFNLLLILEIVCFFILGMPPSYKKDFSLPNLPSDHIGTNVGDVLYSDSVYKAILIKNNDTVYNVKYSIDHFNKRITPNHDSLAKKHAVFFGCSIAFGEGLNDDQTLASYFQKESGYNSYNYGVSGHGTNNMLARLQYQNLTKQIVEKDGVAFYIFFWDHIYRSIGSMHRYCDWMRNAPYYKIENNVLVRKKMFKDGRYVISKIYQFIYQTNIVKYFKIDFPLKLNDRHFDLVTEIIKESKKEYQKQFGNTNKFYCVIYPNYIRYTPEELKKFKDYLTKKEIDYIDLSEFIKYDTKYTLGGDPHPNANTNELLAKEIVNRSLKTK